MSITDSVAPVRLASAGVIAGGDERKEERELCASALDGTVLIDESGARSKIQRSELARAMRPKIDAIKNERVVFVDFDEALEYGDIVSVMDTVKGMGKDASGNESNPVTIALKEPHVECKTLEQAE